MHVIAFFLLLIIFRLKILIKVTNEEEEWSHKKNTDYIPIDFRHIIDSAEDTRIFWHWYYFSSRCTLAHNPMMSHIQCRDPHTLLTSSVLRDKKRHLTSRTCVVLRAHIRSAAHTLDPHHRHYVPPHRHHLHGRIAHRRTMHHLGCTSPHICRTPRLTV